MHVPAGAPQHCWKQWFWVPFHKTMCGGYKNPTPFPSNALTPSSEGHSEHSLLRRQSSFGELLSLSEDVPTSTDPWAGSLRAPQRWLRSLSHGPSQKQPLRLLFQIITKITLQSLKESPSRITKPCLEANEE